MIIPNIFSSINDRRTRKRVQKFYQYQQYLEERHIEDQRLLAKQPGLHFLEMSKQERKSQKWDKWLARITLFINIAMIIAKIIASWLSNSLAIISSVVDSVMDVSSGAVVWICIRAIQKTNRYEYPLGRNRLEPLAVVLVAIIMVMTNLIVIGEAALSTVEEKVNPTVDLPTVVIMAIGTVLKAILFIFCRTRHTPGAKVLALDQRNDVLTNIVALSCAYIGHRWWIYADPIGAFLVCSFIIVSWISSALEEIPLLVGKAASPEFINRIVKIAISHDEHIQHLDTLIVYHLGANFIVELHVVMDSEMKLKETHDISESLQVKLELLPFVERAFVHCDYKFDGDEHVTRIAYAS